MANVWGGECIYFLPWHPLELLENEMCCSYMLLDPLGFGSEVLIVCGFLYTTVLFLWELRLMLYDCCACN